LCRNQLVDDNPVADLVVVGVRQSADHGLAQPEAGIDGHGRSVRRERVGGEHDPGNHGEHHPLDDHGELHAAMVDPMLPPVVDRAVGEERRPTAADMLQ